MNERIKELADQAYSYANNQTGEFTPEFMGYYDERFAELIVQECAAVMSTLEADIKQKFPWKKDEVVTTSGHIQKLKEHFGVEQ